MKVDFNGLRRNLTNAYNNVSNVLSDIDIPEHNREALEDVMTDLGNMIVCCNACYLDGYEPMDLMVEFYEIGEE